MSAQLLYRDARGHESGAEIPEAGAFIGRALECVVRTDDAMVSRRNCKISLVNGHWYVEDLGSANGTYLTTGSALERRIQSEELAQGDVIRCGSLLVRFVETADAAAQRHPRHVGAHPPIEVSRGVEQSETNLPSIVGSYRIVRLLGQGGMGEVYEAVHESIGRRVAIKALYAEFAHKPEIVARFFNEARAVNLVEHPGLVQIYDYGQLPDGIPYIVMEFLGGETLATRLKRAQGPLSLSLALHIGWQLADSLAAAHERGIVHRDIKPDNVMMVPDPHFPMGERTKLLDFGIAKVAPQPGGAAVRTRSGVVMGTPRFMSPEQCRGADTVDAKSDVYSFGVMLYEMIAGRTPFEAESAGDWFVMHIRDAPPPIQNFVPELPFEIATLIDQLLAKEPVARPSMRQVLTDLARVRGLSSLHSMSTPVGQLDGINAPSAQLVEHSLLRQGVPVLEQSPGNRGPEIALRTPGAWDAIARCLPDSLTNSMPQLEAFFQSTFQSCEYVGASVLRLNGPNFPDTANYEFFAVFMGESTGHEGNQRLGTSTFLGYALPLEVHLAKLAADTPKVIVAVVDSVDLGRGVREKILEFRRRFEALVIPLYIGEIQKAARQQRFAHLLLDRLTDLHTIPDLFAKLQHSDDPTRFFGMQEGVNELVTALCQGRGMLAVYGLPGAGKSAFLIMTEYGLGTTRLLTVECNGASHRKPALLAEEIARVLERGPDSPSEPAQPDPSMAIRTRLLRAAQILLVQAEKSGDRPVLLLDNADWLVEYLYRPEPTFESERDSARQLWTALVEMASTHKLNVLVTCVRGYILGQRLLLGWHNPASSIFRSFRVPPLDARAVERLISELGIQMNVRFAPDAIREVYRLTEGHVTIVRRLCSHIVNAYRRSDDYHALRAIEVSNSDVVEAASDLAEDRSTFSESVLSWLNPSERLVLKHIVARHPRSQESIKRSLGDAGTATPDEIASAVDHLRQTGLIRRRDGREQVAMPLLASWVERNIDRGVGEDQQLAYLRMRRLAIGMALTAIMFGIYYSWFQMAMQDTPAAEQDGCIYSVKYPQRGIDKVTIYLSRQCRQRGKLPDGQKGHLPVAVQAAPGTIARFGDQWGDLADAMRCPQNHPNCTQARIEIELVSASNRQYEFSIHADGNSLSTFHILHDPMAALQQLVASGMKVASTLPLIIAAMIAFYKDVLNALRRLTGALGRRPSADSADPTITH